jgi:hypothetical protein
MLGKDTKLIEILDISNVTHQFEQEASISRLYGAIHYRIDTEMGLQHKKKLLVIRLVSLIKMVLTKVKS